MENLKIDLLDVGAIEYGDSILVQSGGLTALIDGGKIASGTSTTSQVLGDTVIHKPLDVQIRELIGSTNVDLLVVTHCHSDHIGCLPQLFAQGRLTCNFALLADPQLGYGITKDSDLLPDFAQMAPADKLRLALREEPVTSTDSGEILDFIEDSAREYSAYLDFVKRMREQLGAKCVEFRGLEEEASPGIEDLLLISKHLLGLKIYGPTLTQLVRCAGFLEGRSDDVDAVKETIQQNNGDLAAAYRALQPIPSDADLSGDTEGENGNAVNNQSMVLSVGEGAHRILLTGDMQFVRPQLADEELQQEMKKLVDAVLADAPFGFVKLSHHGATNGQNLEFLRKLGSPLFGISTGSRSGKHPTGPTLAALKTLAAEKPIQWVRVDINGRCGFELANGVAKLAVSRNGLNDLTPAAERAADAVEMEAPAVSPPQLAAPTLRSPEASISETRIPAGEGVEVLVRIPRGVSKVTVTIEVAGSPLA